MLSAVLLLGRPAPSAGPATATAALTPAPVSTAAPPPATTTVTLRDGRSAHLVSLGGADSDPLLRRIAAELDSATDAVSAFWGPQWRRDITIVATGSDAQFTALAGGGADIAAATTAERILFAPGAATMTDDALRIVVRHELFHYAARPDTAADAPRWLTEGVADYVGRPPAAAPPAELRTTLPTDTELDTVGATRSVAYDRAWWFASYVADRYGPDTLRAVYVRACGPGHPDVATALHDTLGADLDEVVAGWRHWQAR